jgi:hypothetical protein
MVQRVTEATQLSPLDRTASLAIIAMQSNNDLKREPNTRAALDAALMQGLATLLRCKPVRRSEGRPFIIVAENGCAALVEGVWLLKRGNEVVGCVGYSRDPKRDWPILGRAVSRHDRMFTPLGHVDFLHGDGRWPRFLIHSPHIPVLRTVADLQAACERRVSMRIVRHLGVVG